jgi:hypothetical protein
MLLLESCIWFRADAILEHDSLPVSATRAWKYCRAHERKTPGSLI